MANEAWSRRDPPNPEIVQIREHVVQIEGLVSYLLLVMVGLFVVANVVEPNQSRLLVWLAPACFLAGWRAVLRVTNPTSGVRNRLTWAATLGGIFGAIGGAAADISVGGLSGGQGTAWGLAVGSAAGAALGDSIERWGKNDEMLQRGDAFLYLLNHRSKNPKLANAKSVDEALDKHITSFDINTDGRRWYSRKDLDQFIG